MKAKAPHTGRLARTAVLGLATARVGAAHLKRAGPAGAGVQDAQAQAAAHEAEMGRILFQALSQLRGTALKVSQVLSMEATFLPPGVRAELARACHQVMPLNRALVGQVFRRAFGCEPQALFQHFESQAFAAASLGQVHRARLPDGTPVVVKVQYPGMAASMDTDMRLIQTVLMGLRRSGTLRVPDEGVVTHTLAEIQAQLALEVDYLHEARQLDWFATHAAFEGMVFPQVVADLTRTTVLTQSALEGLHLEAWLKTQPSQAQRDHCGQQLWDWFWHCALKVGHIQADVHPGNVLFLPDGRLGLLDFGCTRALSVRFQQGLLASWTAFVREPAPELALLTAYRALGLVSPHLTMAAFESEVMPGVRPLLRWATEPLRASRFDFAGKSSMPVPEPEVHRRLTACMMDMPVEMLSFDRAWMGLMHILKQMGACVWTRGWESF